MQGGRLEKAMAHTYDPNLSTGRLFSHTYCDVGPGDSKKRLFRAFSATSA